MTQIPDNIKEKLFEYVRRDLSPSWPVVHAKIGTSVGLGGLVTLFLCGQLGLGLSPLAMRVHHALMSVIGNLGCTTVCGIIFAVLPVLMLRLMSTGIQFHILIRKKWPVIAGWVFIFGSIIAYQRQGSTTLGELFLWAAVAALSFEVLAQTLHRISVIAANRLAFLRL